MPRKKPLADDKKQANGQGSVFWSESNHCFFATYTRGLTGTGRPIVKRFRAQTEEDARAKRDTDRARWQDGLDTSIDPDSLTVRDLVSRYLTTVNRGDATIRRHKRNARLHICPDKPVTASLGHVPIGRLREDHLAALYASVSDRPALAAQLHATMHAVLAWAVKRRRWLAQNVADFVEPPPYSSPELHPPSPAQINRFFETAESTQNRMLALWWFLSLTGCRPGESLGCEWRDLEDGEWWVRRTRSTETTRIQPIKTKEPRRVALGATLEEILREHRKAQMVEIETAGTAWEDNGLVFCTMAGRPLRWSNIKQSYYYPLARSLHLAFSPYVFFRHAAVTQMLAAGVPIQDVSFRTGHSIETIREFYAHRIRERDEAAVAAFEDRLAKAKQPAQGAGDHDASPSPQKQENKSS